MSKEEQEAAIEILRRNAIRTPNRYEGIKAVEALAAYGKEAIPKLLEVSDNTGLASPGLNKPLNLKSTEAKKKLNPDILNLHKHRGNNYELATWVEKRFKA